MGMPMKTKTEMNNSNFLEEKLANAFDTKTQASSSHRRIQRFIASYMFDSDVIARLIFALLPHRNGLRLSIDRTNWKFGQVDINILMLGICYKGLAFPLLFTMLEKRGNSNTDERIKLIDRFENLFGLDCIDTLMAYREFVGDRWLEYLNLKGIEYHIRIRNNFKAYIPKKQQEVKVSWLFNSLKIGEFKHYNHIIRLGSQLCYISESKVLGSNNETEYLIIVSYSRPEQALIKYKDRWQINATPAPMA